MKVIVLLLMFGMLIPATLRGAEIFYEQDFENGADGWEFQDMEISDKNARSGTHSILSTGKGVGVPSARVPLDLPRKDQLDDVIWFYVDGTLKGNPHLHHIHVWTNDVWGWVGPHIGIRGDNLMVYAINGFPLPAKPVNLEPRTWYRLRTEINLKNQTFNCYVESEGEEMATVFEDTSFIKNRGGALGDKMTGGGHYFRQVGRWESPGADVYFDDLQIADEIPFLKDAQQVQAAGNLTITWGNIKTESR